MSPNTEQVVLLDNAHNPIGTADKSTIHDSNTPLHLAFSCYLFNQQGDILLTRRSLDKIAWPGVWTNSFCGHPLPGETFESALHRRAMDELGATIGDIVCIAPDFSYFARDRNGIVENEFCPVHRATLTNPLDPRPSEVMDWAWVNPADMLIAMEKAPFLFSPWMAEQLRNPQLVAGLKA